MAEIDLLVKYPKSKRNIKQRAKAKNPSDVAIDRKFGKEFFNKSDALPMLSPSGSL